MAAAAAATTSFAVTTAAAAASKGGKEDFETANCTQRTTAERVYVSLSSTKP